MQSFKVSPEESGKKLIRTISSHYPNVPVHRFQKALRARDIRINGEKQKLDCIVQAGQEIQIYLPDEQFLPPTQAPLHCPVVYEDSQVLLLNKPQGMTVHPGSHTPEGSTLIEQLRQNTHNPDLNLLHRLDRNTGGLLLLAKTRPALKKLQDAMEQGLILKRYRCLVKGVPEIGEPLRMEDGDVLYETHAYWERPNGSDLVFIHSDPRPGDLPIVTRYRVLRVFTGLGAEDAISELEVELGTGRTHQIRAHLAFLGHPVLGDGKYGRNAFNLQFQSTNGSKLMYQQLFATSLHFGGPLPEGLRGLARKTFRIPPAYDLALDGLNPESRA